MTLDEAIEHCKELSSIETACSREHGQLADWLKELKNLRKAKLRLEQQSSDRFAGLLA